MNDENIKKLILEMEIKALEKWNKGDSSGYLNIYSPDFTYFDPFQEKRLDGFEKIQDLYNSLDGSVNITHYEMIDPIVQLSEGMAVLTYNLISYTDETIYKWNCTEVYQLREGNQWKIVHNHWSLIKPLG